MNLGQLRSFLEKYPSDRMVENGFDNPHSYRGYYDQVAFEPCYNTTVGEMLECVNKALSESFYGWKGGVFEYNEDTLVYFAYHGSVQDDDMRTLVKVMDMFLQIATGEDLDYLEE